MKRQPERSLIYNMNEEHQAGFFRSLPDNKVGCTLCPHQCIIPEGMYGRCRVRLNHKGVLLSCCYGRIAAAHIDPIEKKPLAEFMPGTRTFSIGTLGCNLDCDWCQNDSLSRADYRGQFKSAKAYSPEEIVQAAIYHQCPSISYTYNEPTVFAEFVADTAAAARRNGLKNVLVSNAFINIKAAETIFQNIDAANFDVKAFSDDTYRNRIHGSLEPVLQCVKFFFSLGKHLELTMLIIPGINDNPDETESFAEWVCRELDPAVVVHLTAFHPAARCMHIPATRKDTLFSLRETAIKAGLKNILLGNI